MVCCVGANSSRGSKEPKLDTDTDTRLQVKLKNLSDQFTVYAIYSAAGIFVLMLIILLFQMAYSSSGDED